MLVTFLSWSYPAYLVPNVISPSSKSKQARAYLTYADCPSTLPTCVRASRARGVKPKEEKGGVGKKRRNY